MPWCCIIPVALSLLGVASPALARGLMNITIPLLLLSVFFIGYANYWVYSGKCRRRRNKILVLISTVISILLWLWSFSRMGWIEK